MERDIKKAFDEIKVPHEKLNHSIQKGLPPKKRKPIQTTILAVTATALMVLGAGFILPNWSEILAKVPIIGFLYDIEKHDPGLQEALSNENKIVLNETITDAGVSITIEEIVYDGMRMNIIFSSAKYEDIAPLYISINGEEINHSESLRILSEENEFRGLWEIKPEEPLPDQFDMTVNIRQIGQIKGDWSFDTHVKKIENGMRTIAVEDKGYIQGIPFEIDSFKTSATTSELKVRFKEKSENLLLSNENGSLHVTITDQNGTPLNILDQSATGTEDGRETIFTYLLEPLNNITELKVIHYFLPILNHWEEIEVPLTDNLPSKIELGKETAISITALEYEASYAHFTFEVLNDFPYDYYFTPHAIDIVNEEGESLVTDYIHAVGPNKYSLSYQANAGNAFIKIREALPLQVEEKAIITIPMPQ